MPASRALMVPVTPDPAWNIQGVGIGEKLVDGRHTGIMAVKFFVRAKYHNRHIIKKHALPKSIEGLPVDVEEVGQFQRFRAAGDATTLPNPRTKIRPAPPGCSVGFADPNNQFVDAGTFGALVRDGNRRYILSNNHVLADENHLPIDSPIFQPGLLDGGNPDTDQIAQLTKFEPLRSDAPNEVDCAIATVLDPGQESDAILQIGPPNGTGDARLHMVVEKFGRATGYTAGRVTCVDADVLVPYQTGTFRFDRQIMVVGLDGKAFSDVGDSGALIVEQGSHRAVGLLIAGSSSHSIANHINAVLEKMEVTLA